MAATIEAPNFDSINIKTMSLLTADIASGATVIPLQDVTSFAINDFLYLGNLGQETTEKVTISTITGNNVTLASACLYAHQRFEAVTDVLGDQIRFYTAPNVDGTIPADSSFSELVAVNITQNQLETSYSDASGDSNTWYKFTYYNSVSTAETALTNSRAVRGNDYGHYTDIDSIREEAGLKDVPEVTDSMLNKHRLAAESLINGILTNNYLLPLQSPYPDTLVYLTTLLAAGYTLNREYSVLSPDMSKLGSEKVDEATAILDQITIRELVLTDQLGNSLALPVAITGWPDETTATTPESQGGSRRMFHVGHKF